MKSLTLIKRKWTYKWSPDNYNCIEQPTERVGTQVPTISEKIGDSKQTQDWSRKTEEMLHKWGLRDTLQCDCVHNGHIIFRRPITWWQIVECSVCSIQDGMKHLLKVSSSGNKLVNQSSYKNLRQFKYNPNFTK